MRALDYAARFLFFATIPFLATFAATLIPMIGVVINVALTLLVFAFAEVVRERAERSRLVKLIVGRQLAFDAYYREHPPRPFLFYVLYPLMLPYVLSTPLARRELGLYRGFTGGSLVILVAASAFDFYRHWQPDLGFTQFIGVWLGLFVVQTLALFVFLLPISTTVVKLHSERRLRALWVLFGVATISVACAAAVLIHRRGHIVSWVTSHRVLLRTKAVPEAARNVQLKALHAVVDNYAELRESTDATGWVEGDAADRAEDWLGLFYKPDEAYAFSLHALPANMPEVVVLQCWIIGGGPPIWRALRRTGQEITDPKDLPKGVLGLKRRSTRRAGTSGGAGFAGAGAKSR